MHDLFEQLLAYLRAIWRYRWFGAVAAWVVAVAGWTAVDLLADRYQASARVYVDTQSILRPLLAGLVTQPNVNQIVEMMSRTLISRPNVEKVIVMANMDTQLKTADERDAMVTRLTRELTIKSSGAENFYTIAYANKDPQQAKRVVQSLLSIFVEGSLSNKRKDTDSARSFIDEQLKIYGEKLTAAENAVTEFKRRNMGLMPGQGQNFYSRLGEAQVAVNQARLELAEAEQGRDAIKSRLMVEAPPSLLDERPAPEVVTPEAANPELDARIQVLQQKLDGLRLTFTEHHPDIVAILHSIDQLKEQRQRENERKQREMEQRQREAKLRKPSPVATQTQDPLLQQLTVSMSEFEATVASLKARVAEYERRLNGLKAAANAIPQVEAEYTQLTRDYEVTKKNYEQLVSRRESAQITGDMQSNASVMDFREVDPPQVPAVPEWPNRPLFKSLVFLASLAGGVGFAFLMSQLRPTINSERSLREIGGVPVFGTVIMAWTEAQRRREKMGLIALSVCIFGLLSVYAAIMAAPIIERITNFETFFRLS
jgi:polysaccharide chain length determinant protein (PEP-CTERM system associated)